MTTLKNEQNIWCFNNKSFIGPKFPIDFGTFSDRGIISKKNRICCSLLLLILIVPEESIAYPQTSQFLSFYSFSLYL